MTRPCLVCLFGRRCGIATVSPEPYIKKYITLAKPKSDLPVLMVFTDKVKLYKFNNSLSALDTDVAMFL